MKLVWLVRHAKSSWRDASLSDRERPLNRRGERDAPVMGRRVAHQGDPPQLIVSSPALRAVRTAQVMARTLRLKRKALRIDERLYLASAAEVRRRLEALPVDIDRVMLVGHNPEFTRLTQHWAPQIMHLPTCAVVRLRFAAHDWRDLWGAEVAQLQFDYPKRRDD